MLDGFHRSLIDYRDELFDIEPQAPPAGGFYAGAEACVPSHPDEYAQWQTTGHARAIESLEISGQDYNPECVACHVNGFKYLGGFERPDLTPALAGVQCEMCHGARGSHPASDNGTREPPDELTCRICHSGTHSPSFDYESYLPQVAH